jgi:hypothetical protein
MEKKKKNHFSCNLSSEKSFGHDSCPIMGSFAMTASKKTPQHFATFSQIWIPRYKVPRLVALELGCTFVIPDPMPLR